MYRPIHSTKGETTHEDSRNDAQDERCEAEEKEVSKGEGATSKGRNSEEGHQTEMPHLDAVIPAKATSDHLRQMLQSLLADRFKLTVHREKRQSQEYVLRVAKGGPKLKPASGTEEPPHILRKTRAPQVLQSKKFREKRA